ncbi:MAG: hypothetical protein WD397_07235 [Wenzhouxiangellaceae bacterium]
MNTIQQPRQTRDFEQFFEKRGQLPRMYSANALVHAWRGGHRVNQQSLKREKENHHV